MDITTLVIIIIVIAAILCAVERMGALANVVSLLVQLPHAMVAHPVATLVCIAAMVIMWMTGVVSWTL